MEKQLADYYDRLVALHDSLRNSVADLSPEALDWTPGPAMNSLAVLIVHTASAERYWIGDVAGRQPSNRVRATEFQTGQTTAVRLQSLLDDTLTHSRTVLAALTVADLEQPRVSAMHDNRAFTTAWALAHALEHTALHTGHAEITRQLWDQTRGA